MSQLRKATRTKAKIRLGLSAVSGGGKTYGAILIAKGLASSLSKVAIIDTENGSADLYSHLGDYNVLSLSAPYTPEKYISAIKACEAEGMEVIIIDSIAHLWSYILAEHGAMAGNSFTNWSKFKPRTAAFRQAVNNSSAHTIETVRRKTDYELSQNSKGQNVPTKVGLKEVTEDGWEYELTICLAIDANHYAVASKDRTLVFDKQPDFIISEETGKLIKDWCELGIHPVDTPQQQLPQVSDEVVKQMVKAVKEGARTTEQLKQKYQFTPEQELQFA
jgi:hypothetical protein